MSTMPSVHAMEISTGILGCTNDASLSHNLETHTYSLRYKASTIILLVDVSIETGENDSV